MLNFIKKIRENLKNPKKRAITQLVLYAVFFTFVFLIISSANSSGKKSTIKKEEKLVYSYSYSIVENNITTYINGSSDKETFMYNNVEYNINDIKNNIIENPVKYNVSDYYYDNIKELINKSEFIEKTTYKDDSTKSIYNIKVSDYFNDKTYECINNCDNNITITVYEKKYINNVIIDLINVNNYNYTIDIKYENIESK